MHTCAHFLAHCAAFALRLTRSGLINFFLMRRCCESRWDFSLSRSLTIIYFETSFDGRTVMMMQSMRSSRHSSRSRGTWVLCKSSRGETESSQSDPRTLRPSLSITFLSGSIIDVEMCQPYDSSYYTHWDNEAWSQFIHSEPSNHAALFA